MNNKRRGYTYELKALNELKAAGYDAIHSGDSLGPFDIWATNANEFKKIQVKAIKKPKNFRPLIEQISKSKEPPGCVKELWVWLERRGWTKTICQ